VLRTSQHTSLFCFQLVLGKNTLVKKQDPRRSASAKNSADLRRRTVASAVRTSLLCSADACLAARALCHCCIIAGARISARPSVCISLCLCAFSRAWRRQFAARSALA